MPYSVYISVMFNSYYAAISLPEDVQSEASDANINKRILKEKDDKSKLDSQC